MSHNDALANEDLHMRSSASDDDASEVVGDEELFPGSTSGGRSSGGVGGSAGGDIPRSNPAAASTSTPHRPFGINGMTPPDSQHGPSSRAGPPSSIMDSSPPMTGGRHAPAQTTAQTTAAAAAGTGTGTEDISMGPIFPSTAQAQQSAAEGVRRAPLATNRRTDDEEAPGHAWMNKHARDAYVRAMESLVDDGFSLNEFGDPFNESDMIGRGGHR
ncbi:MAG: hypothetical protein M1815_000061 [Lichina confinis]|nr:MAG: hypothetical protein M1815_000061 [Lichina confinis]